MNKPLNHGIKTLFLMVIIGWATITQATLSWTYTYNSNGQILTADGPRTGINDRTTYTYDAVGNLATVTNALGHIVQRQNYNSRGQPGTIIDANGVETVLTYNVRGWLLTSTIKDPSNPALDAITLYDYDNVGQITRITLPEGAILNYGYDGAQRLTTISNNLGERIEYTFDTAGNRTQEQIKIPNGFLVYTHQKAFDGLSRLLDDSGANGQNTHYNYDTNNNPTTSTDALSNQTQQTYDALDRPKMLTDAEQNNIHSSYDSQDHIKTVTDQRGITTAYHYSGLGYLTRIESPDTGTSLFSHDGAGNIIQRTDARNIVTLYSYDALNRLLTVSYPANSAENIRYHYDSIDDGNNGIGRLTDIINDSVSQGYYYDHRGNITTIVQQIDDSLYSTTYGYDLANNISKATYPSGRILNYTRNTLGNITAISTQSTISSPAENIATNIEYLPYGDLTGFTYGNGVQTNLRYDQDYRLTTLNTLSGAAHNKLYSYDAANNITAITDTDNQALSQTFNYDQLYRVSQEAGTYGTKTYLYDSAGNRTQRTISTLDETGSPTTRTQKLTYAINSNRLIKRGNKETTMDAVGNTLSERNNKKEFVYNNANRLVRFIKEGVIKADYRHNALGQRVEKRKYKNNGTRTFHYFYDHQGQLINRHVTNINGTSVDFDYIWLNNRPIARFKTPYKVDGTINIDKRKTTWLHTDHLNTPRVGTDNQQRVVWRWDSDAFGKGGVNSDPDGDGIKRAIGLRFPGQYKDGESGLHYNYFRDYDPSLGRYIQSDPIGILRDYSDPRLQAIMKQGIPLQSGVNGLGLNYLYGYAEQNPLTYDDLMGLRPIKNKKGYLDGTDSSACRLMCAFDPTVTVAAEGASQGLSGLGALGKAFARRANLAGNVFGAAGAFYCMDQCRENESESCLNPDMENN